MAEASISHSTSDLYRRIAELISADNRSAIDGLKFPLQVQVSTPLSPKEGGENAEFVAGRESFSEKADVGFRQEENRCSSKPVSADSERVGAVVSEDMKETEGNCILALGNPKDESSGSDVLGATGFEALGVDSGKISEKIESVGGDFGCPLEIELIDDTAVIGLSKFGVELETAGRKKELEVKKEKKPRRKSKAAKKGSDVMLSIEQLTRYKGTEGTKIAYPRKFLEALRYSNVKAQKKLWQKIYNGLSSTVKNEYNEMSSFRQNQNKQSYPPRAPCVLGELCKETVNGDLEIPIPVESNFDDTAIGEAGQYLCEEYVEDEDSDDSYCSIQRRAFYVEGEPDFDSGPPEDGLEYLRRVRWEAAKIPKVKVAKLDKSEVKEQSVYMPEIPEIERCPEHLLPLKQWEEEFLSDFSELRLAIAHDDVFRDLGPIMVPPSTSKPVPKIEANDDASPQSTSPAVPTLSGILKMDLVSRINMLKNRIYLFESKDELSRNECLWLFGLCAAVDTPLDAHTSAALRGLLRHCSRLRARKSEFDDEALMLNILVTISGKYFGQAEN